MSGNQGGKDLGLNGLTPSLTGAPDGQSNEQKWTRDVPVLLLARTAAARGSTPRLPGSKDERKRRERTERVPELATAFLRPQLGEWRSGLPFILAVHRLWAEAVFVPKNPMVGSFTCCAGAASGHTAAAPPSSVMNCRRLTSSMGSPPEPAGPAYRRLRLPRKQRQVPGVDLNCSESGATGRSPDCLKPKNRHARRSEARWSHRSSGVLAAA